MTAPGVCGTCKSPLVNDACPRCTERAEAQIAATQAKMQSSRDELNAWRDRLRMRLEESDRKRTVLSTPTARVAAQAPTLRLPDEADDDLDPLAPLPGFDEQPPAHFDAPTTSTFDADPTPFADLTPAAAGDGDPLLDGWTDHDDDGPIELPSVDPPARDDAALYVEPDAAPSLAGVGFGDQLGDGPPRPPAEPMSPSIAVRWAALILDLLLLLLLPAAIVSLPSWLQGRGQGLGAFWAQNGAELVPLSVVLFVLLETLYVGAFGRTPAMRLLGLRVLDIADDDLPTFAQALIRALIFPLLVVPLFERLASTQTVNS